MLRILLWEVVLGRAGRACPGLVAEVDLTERIEDGCASFALHGCVVDQRHVLDLLQRCVEAADGHDDARRRHFIAGPVVPGEADAIAHLPIVTLFHGDSQSLRKYIY